MGVFQAGLSGVNVAARNLDVIGNNVANANTVGFKYAQAQFADVYAGSLVGAGPQVGIGASIAAVVQQFNQGNMSTTNNPMDMAINGGGFFKLSDPLSGAISYTRNGQFQIDKNGFVVTNNNKQVNGYPANATGAIVTAAPAPLQIPSANLLANATTKIGAGLNLDSRVAAPATAVFNPNTPTSFNNSTSTTIYDSLGAAHVATMYFQKQPAPAVNAWNAYLTIDGTSVPALPATMSALTFSTAGTIATPAGGLVAGVPFAPAGAAPMSLTFDFSTTSQFGSLFSVNNLTQDGFTSGSLTGVNTGVDGVMTARYSNGQNRAVGQVVLASFTNQQGLQSMGGNDWAETSTSGAPLIGVPGSGKLGAIQAGATEDSNVDMTAELVHMITAQRTYQANAQTIKTMDQVLQTVVNLR